MANPVYELDPVTHITADAVGTPGHRIFYIQAERGLDRITLLTEKQHIACARPRDPADRSHR